MSTSIDWSRLEEIVERAVRKARAEELRDVAEAVKMLAEYMKSGFEKMLERIEGVERRLETIESILLDHGKRLEAVKKTLLEYGRRLEDHSKILQEHSKRLEEYSRRLEEHSRRIEDLTKVVQEHSKRLEELSRRIEEMNKVLIEHSKRIEEFDRTVKTVAHRYGVLTEESFRDSMRYVVEEIFGVARVEKWVYNDVDGYVYKVPAVIEVDVVIRDREHILLEIKSRVGRGDVYELNRIRELYKKITGVKPRLAILADFIDRGVRELAERLGVEIIPIITPI